MDRNSGSISFSLLEKLRLLVILISIAAFSFPQLTLAKSDTTFGVQPAKIEFDGSKTQNQSSEIKVLNQSEHKIDVKIIPADFIFTNKPKQPFIFTKPGEMPVSALAYLKVDTSKISIKPKSYKKVKVIYKSGKKIVSGKYSALLFQVTKEVKRKDATAIKVAGRIATTIFIVPGKGYIKRQGHIKSFTADSSMYTNTSVFGLKKKPAFTLSFKNTGNTHLNLRAKIYIENMFGKRVQTIKLPDYEVFPGVTRDLEIPWDNRKVGFFKAKAEVKSFLYDYAKDETSKNAGFFFVPYWITIGVFALMLGITGRFYFRRRKKKRKRLQKETESASEPTKN